MITKKINGYWCEFCKKFSRSAPHMTRHERGCTLNPARICKPCRMMGIEQKPIADLIATLPKVEGILSLLKEPESEPKEPRDMSLEEMFEGDSRDYEDPWEKSEKIVNAALPALRKLADNCPCCIMAALRQAKIPVPMATDFKFKEELKGVGDRTYAWKNYVADY